MLHKTEPITSRNYGEDDKCWANFGNIRHNSNPLESPSRPDDTDSKYWREFFPFIAGYTIVEQLFEIFRTAVDRAMSTAARCPAAIALLGQEYPNFDLLVHFRNQYTLTQNLNISDL